MKFSFFEKAYKFFMGVYPFMLAEKRLKILKRIIFRLEKLKKKMLTIKNKFHAI